MNFSLPGFSSPAAVKAAKIKRELEAKAAARQFDRYCADCGINAAEAHLLAPALVRKGQTIRRIEERKRQQAALKAKKQKLEQRFGDQRTGP